MCVWVWVWVSVCTYVCDSTLSKVTMAMELCDGRSLLFFRPLLHGKVSALLLFFLFLEVFSFHTISFGSLMTSGSHFLIRNLYALSFAAKSCVGYITSISITTYIGHPGRL